MKTYQTSPELTNGNENANAQDDVTEVTNNETTELEDDNDLEVYDDEDDEEDYEEYEEYDDYDDYDDYGTHFGRYAGTYAQDVAGYSDDVIDDVFEGDPDAYWNID